MEQLWSITSMLHMTKEISCVQFKTAYCQKKKVYFIGKIFDGI